MMLGLNRRSSDPMKGVGCANPWHNLTEMLHVLGEQTGMKLSCIKSQRYIYRAWFQHRLH